MHRHHVLIGWTVLLSAAGGCARPVLMPTPILATEGLINPFRNVPPVQQHDEVTVFSASTRGVSGDGGARKYYTNDRGRDVRLGIATVQIGGGMSWEEVVRASRATNRHREPEVRLTGFEEYGALWATTWPTDYRFVRDWQAPGVDRTPTDRFIEAVESRLATSRRKQILIYVHGFATHFDRNLELTAEFYHYMGRDGVYISFDWPSRGSLFSYQVDKANAEFAIRQLRELLRFLAQYTSADEINIMAHSAGCPVVAEALRQLSLIHYHENDDEVRERTRLGRVVLAAPDMDLDLGLSAAVDGAGRVCRDVVVYASRNDRALGVSSLIFDNVRVGSSIGYMPLDARAVMIAHASQWIDVTPAQGHHKSITGHSYYHQNPWVSSDCMLFLRLGARPEDRGLVRDMGTGFMTFPADYEQRLPAIVDRLIEAYHSSPARLGR